VQQGAVVDLDAALALNAARLGVDHKLPLADSIVYATARAVGGVVRTQDEDFDGLPDVQYFPKRHGSRLRLRSFCEAAARVKHANAPLPSMSEQV